MNPIGIDAPMLTAFFMMWLIIISGLVYLLYDRVKTLEETIRKKKRPPH